MPVSEATRRIRLGRLAEHLNPVTKFTKSEIIALVRMHQEIVSVYNSQMSKHVFFDILANLFDMADDYINDNIFRAVNYTETGFISEEEWIRCLDVFLLGNLEERARFAFCVYDLHKSGELKKLEIEHFIQHGLGSSSCFLDDPEENMKDIIEIIFSVFDKRKLGKIEFKDFYAACKQEPLLTETLGHCMPDYKNVKALLALFDGRDIHDVFGYLINFKGQSSSSGSTESSDLQE